MSTESRVSGGALVCVPAACRRRVSPACVAAVPNRVRRLGTGGVVALVGAPRWPRDVFMCDMCCLHFIPV